MVDLPDIEVAIVIETNDPALGGDLAKAVPGADFSVADRFVGGAEIAVFVSLVKDSLAPILGFLTANRDRVTKGSVRIGKEEIELTGFSDEQIINLLEQPAFKEALRTVKS